MEVIPWFETEGMESDGDMAHSLAHRRTQRARMVVQHHPKEGIFPQMDKIVIDRWQCAPGSKGHGWDDPAAWLVPVTDPDYQAQGKKRGVDRSGERLDTL
jgi:hypothetical protein